ncbi:MAG TPA: IS200/IS605 family transposase [Planctomycetaceae bacterium]|jgi:REP element-mobilizing transposase RayT|nr:IS200/IS605 family transposase [Planctomycetaceae bacterium]
MSQTHTNLNYHIIFGTKDRRPTLLPEFRDDLCRYLGGIVKNSDGHPLEINAVEDHAHMLVRLPPTVALANVIRAVKAGSSKWLNETRANKSKFAWQDGYAAFSVSQSHLPQVAEYVRNQAEHHRRKSFREELVAFLKRNAIAYDERYLPD